MKNNHTPTIHHSLTLGWLYPELMSTYGDRGNVIVLQKRAQWRGINIKIERINQNTNYKLLTTCDLLFMGGAQDIQQEIVNEDLLTNKGNKISEMIEDDTPALFICGAYQLMGNYYLDSNGVKINGLGLFDMYTQAPQTGERLIGNIVIQPKSIPHSLLPIPYLTGFENHGGRTYLSNKSQAFAQVISGYGNNGNDKTEGAVYKNAIGTYLHGPILPANPELADTLLEKTFARKYGIKLPSNKTDDTFSKKAKGNILKKLKASY